MTISVSKFETLSQGTKANFDFRVFGELVDKGREVYEKAMERKESFEKEMNEFVLNAAAPTLAALGHEASKRRVERAEKHGVVGIAEKLANNYRVENFAFGSSISELSQNVVSKPGKKVGIVNVSLRDSLSRHAGLVKKDMLAMHPKELQKQLEKGNVDLRKGSLVLLAHEIAKMSVIHKRMAESGKDLYREYGKVEKRIRHLVGIGQALINGEFSDETMSGGVAAVEAAVKDKTNKRARALTVFGMTVASSVLAACGGSAEAAPAATQTSGNEGQPTVEKTPVVQVSPTIESTPVSIIIPAPTTTAVVEITVGEPIPSIDFVAVPAYVPEVSTPVDDPNISEQVMELREHGLSVLHSAGYVAYSDGDGKEYFPSLDEITSADGETTLKKGEMNEQGVVTYKSEDGKVVENHLLSFDCPDNELCYEALSFNEEDQGILYLIRVDKATGKVVAYVNTGVAGEAVAAGKDIPWQNGESEYWQSSVTGEAALQRGNVKARSYENGVLTFLDETGNVHSVDDDDIAFYPGFGTIVTDNDGWYMWNDMTDKWVLMSQADSYGGTQFANGEVLYDVDGKYVIADENNYYWVEGIEEGDKLTVITEDGRYWIWDIDQGWTEYPLIEWPEGQATKTVLLDLNVPLDSLEYEIVNGVFKCVEKNTGKVVCEDGVMTLDFLQEALSDSDLVGGPIQLPNPNSGRPNQAPNGSKIKDFSVKLVALFRSTYQEVTGEDSRITGDRQNGRIERILIGEDKWAVAVGEKIDENVIFNYLIFEPSGKPGEVRWFPILPVPAEQIDSIWADN